MKQIAFAIALFAIAALAHAQPATQPAADWKPLFNGKDFTGWYTYLKGPGKDIDATHVFSIDDGMIHIYKDAADGSQQLSGYLATNEEFGNCRIRLQYKWGTKRFGSRRIAPRFGPALFLHRRGWRVRQGALALQRRVSDSGE